MTKIIQSTDQHKTQKSFQKQIPKAKINWPVFIGSGVGVLGVVLWTLMDPDNANAVIGSAFSWTTTNLGWLYILIAVGSLVFLLYLALSRYGHVKLGPASAKPEHGTFTWAAMIFAAGINLDLMFFAVSGPVAHYLAPPGGESGSAEAAREGSVWTIFHYGLNGWAIYGLMALSLAYFAYRRNLPLAIRSALYPVLGKRVKGTLGDAVDIAAILGTIFGVATSIGIGVAQLNFGLTAIFGMSQSLAVQLTLIAIGVGISIASAVSGIDRGIKWLSQLNVALAGLLAVFILFVGDTVYLLNALVLNTGDYFSSLLGRSVETFAFDPQNTWMGDWTLFFWAWWIAYAAFVGLFLARISKGRTIREFVAGIMILPFTYIVVWVSIFGNAAIGQVADGDIDFGELAMNVPEEGFYSLLMEYPAFGIVAFIATLTGMLFFITSADSGALVMGHISSHIIHPGQSATSFMRIFWGLALAALTAVMLAAGGIPVLQSATIVIAVPFSIILVLVIFGFYGALRDECGPREKPGLRRAINRVIDKRAKKIFPRAFPGHESAYAYLIEVAQPALEGCIEMFEDEGHEALLKPRTLTKNGTATGFDFVVNAEGGSQYHLEIQTGATSNSAQDDLEMYINGVHKDVVVRRLSYVQLQDMVCEHFRTLILDLNSDKKSQA